MTAIARVAGVLPVTAGILSVSGGVVPSSGGVSPVTPDTLSGLRVVDASGNTRVVSSGSTDYRVVSS